MRMLYRHGKAMLMLTRGTPNYPNDFAVDFRSPNDKIFQTYDRHSEAVAEEHTELDMPATLEAIEGANQIFSHMSSTPFQRGRSYEGVEVLGNAPGPKLNNKANADEHVNSEDEHEGGKARVSSSEIHECLELQP